MNKVALVVDDTSYIREDIKDILEEQGYKVFEAGDGLEAVEMYKKVNPAIVTMDINMPRMHGLKATQVITDFDKNAFAPSFFSHFHIIWKHNHCTANHNFGFLVKVRNYLCGF